MIPENAVRPTISVVVPVYGCAGCLEELCRQLDRELVLLTDRFEVILVDDRSPDGAWTTIRELQAVYPAVKGVRMSRNYGQQVALTAGLAEARGDYAVVMDCDLQDPPSLLPELFRKLAEGFDLVLARRVERNHPLFRVMAARIYVGIFNWLTGSSVDGGHGAYSVLSRKVIDGYLRFGERERHYLHLLRWMGFRAGNVDYVHQPRHCGRSSYSLGKLMGLAMDGLMFQRSVLPGWMVTGGLLMFLTGLVCGLFLMGRGIFFAAVPGWAFLGALVLGCTGMLMTCVGVVGVYVGRLFEQAKQRPLYLKDEVLERRLSW